MVDYTEYFHRSLEAGVGLKWDASSSLQRIARMMTDLERMKVGKKEIKTNYKIILTNEKKRILHLIEKENYNNPRTLKPFYHLFGLIYVIDNNFANNFSAEQQQMLQHLHDYYSSVTIHKSIRLLQVFNF